MENYEIMRETLPPINEAPPGNGFLQRMMTVVVGISIFVLLISAIICLCSSNDIQ